MRLLSLAMAVWIGLVLLAEATWAEGYLRDGERETR